MNDTGDASSTGSGDARLRPDPSRRRDGNIATQATLPGVFRLRPLDGRSSNAVGAPCAREHWISPPNEEAPREAGLLQDIAVDQLLLAMISAITPVAAATIRNWPSSLRTQR